MKLTEARRRGLLSLLAVYPRNGRRSNKTVTELGYVYWQTADWLYAEGLIRFPTGSTLAQFTERGLLLAREIAA